MGIYDLEDRMRREWDRRVAHDYRYWMSDGVKDDNQMWATGQRDLELLLSGASAETLKTKVALEIGCGVGRLLRPASGIFSKVIGVDVSEKALETARDILKDCSSVELVLSSGTSFASIKDAQIDVAYSFAVLGSMPVSVFACTLVELSRVLKESGVAYLQVYLGRTQKTVAEDTIALRSYDKDNFTSACEAAGFTVESIKELVLPFEVSDKEEGITATTVVLKRNVSTSVPSSSIENKLVPGGESEAQAKWPGSETEYLMAIARATQHIEAGRLKEAKETLEFALKHFSNPDPDACEMLEKLCSSNSNPKQIATPAQTPLANTGVMLNPEIFARNLEIVKRRFPRAYEALMRIDTLGNVSISRSTSGDVIALFKGQPLDQVEKPKRASQNWAQRCLNNPSVGENLIVAGFAGGYHIEALIDTSDKQLYVIEPNVEVLYAILGVRDCRKELENIVSLTVSLADFQELLRTNSSLSSSQFVSHPQTLAVVREDIEQHRRAWCSGRGLRELRPSVAVVGPLYGGSLPIAGYVANALQKLGSRVHYYDMQPFHSSYTSIQNFVRNKQRLDTLENNYVEMLSELVLQGITENPVDIVICLAQAPMTGRVLTELRKRGTITAMWFVEDCRRFATWKQISRYYDYMFLIQRDEIISQVEAAGTSHAIYLPVGCVPELHRPLDLTPEEIGRFGSDLSFVGAGYNNRQQVFARLAKRDFKIWGTEWPSAAPFDRLVQEKGRRLSPAEYVKIFNASTINLNLHSSTERDGIEPFGDFVNPRTFELASSGAFQLVDKRSLLQDFFELEKEITTFSCIKELTNQIDYYLSRPEERNKIAHASRKRALTDHTYEERVRSMLGHIYVDNFEHLSAKNESGPWRSSLRAAEKFPELSKHFQAAHERGDEPKLDSIIADIQTSKGSLSETEQKLLFLYHVKTQTSYVNKLRKGE